jgi:1,4-dihydroxy-2-naphthoate octaprenyltransferase
LVVRFGRSKAVYGYALIVFGSYTSIFLSVIAGITPTYTLVALIPFPLAVEAVRHAFRFHSEPFSLVPANATTIVIHLLTSLLLSLGYLVYRLEMSGVGFMIGWFFIGMGALFTAYFYLKIWRAKKPG